jgi:hypothetical protein
VAKCEEKKKQSLKQVGSMFNVLGILFKVPVIHKFTLIHVPFLLGSRFLYIFEYVKSEIWKK